MKEITKPIQEKAELGLTSYRKKGEENQSAGVDVECGGRRPAAGGVFQGWGRKRKWSGVHSQQMASPYY
jgi:hypothetical protein